MCHYTYESLNQRLQKIPTHTSQAPNAQTEKRARHWHIPVCLQTSAHQTPLPSARHLLTSCYVHYCCLVGSPVSPSCSFPRRFLNSSSVCIIVGSPPCD
mmetsp:Transcript_17165/g.41235  ORF Transcript_17165/g.41235 Transcript_17165/m.41235 type:complete len:99 (-) Transcript_17165:391-687(-)